MRIRLRFVWQDLWVGGYWDGERRRLYVCLVPCLPLVFSWPVPCETCGGRGIVGHVVQGVVLGSPLPHAICNGTGQVYP